MFYPAAPDALNALIADVRKRARPDGGVAPKVVIAPHAGLVYSGAVAATAFGAVGAPRRAATPDRHHWPRPSRRVLGRCGSSGVEVAHAARRDSGRGRHACRARPSARRRRRPAAVRGRAFARNAFDHAAGDAAGAVRNRPHSGRRRRSPFGRRGLAPGLGRAGDGRRSLIRLVAFSRSDEARSRSIPTRPGASRRSTPPRSMAAALAAS